jgi:beta-aspartyl-peptidase (threonine type)
MYLLSFFSVTATMVIVAVAVQAEEPHTIPNVVLAIHGGAGPLPREKFKADPALAGRYKEVLKQALAAGQKALHDKDNSLDAVEAAIRVLEDSPLFNAGKGAVFTHDGRNELDAAIMDGKRRAGAVAGITRIRNPIAAARAVLEKSEHVMLVGEGADRFAIHQGLEEVSPAYFWTEHRWKQLQQAIQKEEQHQRTGKAAPLAVSEFAFGTVGAVVLWKDELAAGTSTGGMTNKRPGRVGDSPIIGAGTYAENGACAVSATGHGEVFICHTVAHDLAARVKYLHEPIGKAAADILAEMPKEKDGVGGLIALDSKGNLTMPFNSTGMFRGYVTADGKIYVAIFED